MSVKTLSITAADGKRYINGLQDLSAATAQDNGNSVTTSANLLYTYWSRSGFGYTASEGLLSFDLSGIPVGSKIKSATLLLNGLDFATNPDVQNVEVFLPDWDGVGNIAVGDWMAMSALTSADWATDSDYDFPTGSYADVTHNLSAAAITRLQERRDSGGSGYMTFMLASEYAVAGAAVAFDTWTVAIDVVTNVPELVVTYEPAPGLVFGANF